MQAIKKEKESNANGTTEHTNRAAVTIVSTKRNKRQRKLDTIKKNPPQKKAKKTGRPSTQEQRQGEEIDQISSSLPELPPRPDSNEDAEPPEDAEV